MRRRIKKRIYLDNAAGSHIRDEVLDEIVKTYSKEIGNPFSIYYEGRVARNILEESKLKIAKSLSCLSEEIIFTNGATESDNLAIFGIANQYGSLFKKPRIISSQIEHSVVLKALKELEKKGFDIKLVGVDKYGRVDIKELEKLINNQTILISIMLANNEIGTIQPIRKISEVINKKRKGKLKPPFFHCDATSNYLNFDIKKLKVDLLTLNGNKIGGPKSTGLLFKKKGIDLKPIIFKGNSEISNIQNIPNIAGFAKAIELSKKESIKEIKRVEKIRDYLIKRTLKEIEGSILNGDPKNRLPNNANFIIFGVEGESLVLMLDKANISVSTGSACHSKSLKPSHVLSALNLPLEIIHGSLRISLGRETTKKEIDVFIKELKKAVQRLRKISPIDWRDMMKRYKL